MLRQGILWLRSRARSSRQIKPMLSLLFHLLTFPFDLKSSLGKKESSTLPTNIASVVYDQSCPKNIDSNVMEL